MISNVFLDLFIALFIALSAAVIYKEHNTRLGLIVRENGKLLANGRQGLETEIGRSSQCDVRMQEKSVSRLQAKATYDTKSGFEIREYGATPGNRSAGYFVAGHDLKIYKPIEERCYELSYLPGIAAMIVIALQAVTAYRAWDSPKAVIPHAILAVFLLICYAIRADRAPVIESVFSILLTFYIETTMYPAVHHPENLTVSVNAAITGVAAYASLCLAMKLFLWILVKRPQLYRRLRVLACAAMILLILMNLIFAKSINGARNWVGIGGYSFQPSEPVKLLLIFVLIVPSEDRVHYMEARNLVITIGMPVTCMVYALLIKDSGVLLQYGLIFILSVLLQSEDILKNILIIVSGFLSCKLVVLKISSTAFYRFSNWIGEGSILEGLTGKGIFATSYDYGYQSVHAVIGAFINGGVFGNKSGYDVMSGIEAANSDLVTGLLAQKHGYLFPFLLLGLYLVLLGGCLLSLRQQRKTEQLFSVVAVSLISFTMAFNLAGTYGIVALSGIVSPALSDGISAALCYGPLFGVISSSGLSHTYLKHIKGVV